MADAVEPGTDETARLERALERIARARRRPGSPPGPAADTAVLAARLDALIAELRAVLKKDGAD